MSSRPPQADSLADAPPLSEPDATDVAISIAGVFKDFRIGPATPKTLKERLTDQVSSTSGFRALDDVTFQVNRGETFGVLGHNGSGKSTLLKLIAGIMTPSAGNIHVNGRLSALLELGAGFHPELSGAENIHLNGTILGLDPTYVADVFDDIVDFAELEDFINSPVKHYSSGMRARLGFSVATHLEPDVLLVDEVLAVGDERFRRKCMERVHRFRSMGRTMVLVTHGISLVSQLCTRCAVLSQGKLLFVGEAEEAIATYRASLSSAGAERRRNKNAAPDPATVPVVVTSVEFEGQAKEPVVKPLGCLTMQVQLRVLERIPFRVRLNIRTEEGLVLVNQATSGLLGHPVEADPGPLRVTFELNEIPLRDGRYFIDLMLESPDGSEVHQRMAEAAGFRVTSENRHLGVVALSVACRVEENMSQPPTGNDEIDPNDSRSLPDQAGLEDKLQVSER